MLQHLSEETFGRFFFFMFLYQDVDHLAILVDSIPAEITNLLIPYPHGDGLSFLLRGIFSKYHTE